MSVDKRAPYPFKAEDSLMVEGKLLAKDYKISFNMLLTLLLEEAVQEWQVPGHVQRERAQEVELAVEKEKDLT